MKFSDLGKKSANFFLLYLPYFYAVESLKKYFKLRKNRSIINNSQKKFVSLKEFRQIILLCTPDLRSVDKTLLEFQFLSSLREMLHSIKIQQPLLFQNSWSI